MLHSFITRNGTRFSYNSDLSGDVEITDEIYNRISIPGDDIREFVAEYIRTKRIAELEQMTVDELLTLID